MPTASHQRDYLGIAYEELELGRPAPNPASTRIILLRPGVTLTTASSKADIIAAEIAQANGYDRQVLGRKVAAVDTAGNALQFGIEHELNNGDGFYFAVSDGGSAPAISGYESTIGQKFYVVNSTANTLQVAATPGGTPLDITGAGSGTIVLRPSGSFDAGANNRLEVPGELVKFSAAGAAVQFQGYAMLKGSGAVANVQVSSIDFGADQISTASPHGAATGDEVMLTADEGGAQPGGVSATTIYFARSLSSSIVTLHPTAADAVNNTNRVDIQNAGSGTIRLRSAKGYIRFYRYFSTAQTVPAGANRSLRIFQNYQNTGDSAGV